MVIPFVMDMSSHPLLNRLFPTPYLSESTFIKSHPCCTFVVFFIFVVRSCVCFKHMDTNIAVNYFSSVLITFFNEAINWAVMILNYWFLRKAQRVDLQSCTRIYLVEATCCQNDDPGEINSLWRIRIANPNPQNDSNHSPKASALNICSEKKQNYQSRKPLN